MPATLTNVPRSSCATTRYDQILRTTFPFGKWSRFDRGLWIYLDIQKKGITPPSRPGLHSLVPRSDPGEESAHLRLVPVATACCRDAHRALHRWPMTRMVPPCQRNQEGSATGARHSRTARMPSVPSCHSRSASEARMPATWLEHFFALGTDRRHGMGHAPGNGSIGLLLPAASG